MSMEPILLRHHFQQFHLDFDGRFAGRQPGAIADAKDMRVDGDGRFAEGNIEHDVRGLAAHSRQSFQRLAVMRNHAAMLADELF